jgi:Flp pilus assembly protein TadG
MKGAGRHSRAGNAAIEFALVFGLLWMILSGCFRLGYSIYIYESVLNAIAGAARYAARVDFDEPNHIFITGVRNMAVYGNPSGGTTPLAPGLATGNISVDWTYDAKSIPVTIRVSVTGYSVNALFQTFTWSGKPSVTVRYAGSYKS